MAQLRIGATASYTKIVTDEDVRLFAKVSGDVNPIHLEDEYARKSRFGQRIAHGLLAGSLISNVLGNVLPGHGTIY
jgi:3-hydroxybutyryl-CoA dehydratase